MAESWLVFWIPSVTQVLHPSHPLLFEWTDLEVREEAPYRPWRPIHDGPRGRIDPRLTRYFTRSRLTQLSPEPKRNCITDSRVFSIFCGNVGSAGRKQHLRTRWISRIGAGGLQGILGGSVGCLRVGALLCPHQIGRMPMMNVHLPQPRTRRSLQI